jgi:unsaturated rhamnogalacturonyl hydrolase
MGNDAGNCEFENFNKLAGFFGIHFNEVSRNKVEGTKYEMAAFSKFPNHPLFMNLNKIYLKEISTLALKDPAKTIFEDQGDVIIAGSKYGEGYVLAVGDPLIYNEYIDHRRLPKEYQNYEAAGNLFTWLLGMAKKVK